MSLSVIIVCTDGRKLNLDRTLADFHNCNQTSEVALRHAPRELLAGWLPGTIFMAACLGRLWALGGNRIAVGHWRHAFPTLVRSLYFGRARGIGVPPTHALASLSFKAASYSGVFAPLTDEGRARHARSCAVRLR